MIKRRKNYSTPQIVCEAFVIECGFAVSGNEVNTVDGGSWTDDTEETVL